MITTLCAAARLAGLVAGLAVRDRVEGGRQATARLLAPWSVLTRCSARPRSAARDAQHRLDA
jgi:hypothetical protein